MTWRTAPTIASTAFTSFASIATSAQSPTAMIPGVDLLGLATGWLTNPPSNYGVMLRQSDKATQFASSEYSTVSLRPALLVSASFTCDTEYADCNGDTNEVPCSQHDGCEVHLVSDVLNCGGCGHVCSVPHATPSCVEGNCQVGSCNPGYLDCDGNPFNGCETNGASCVPTYGATGCYWMEAYDGVYSWVPVPSVTSMAQCYVLDSCNGGLGQSGGGCYKWSEGSDGPPMPWTGLTETCSDGVQDQGETGVDCGGPCVPCGAILPSCLAIHDSNPSAISGVYWIDPDGTGPGAPFQAACDMTTDGGGWTMCYTTPNAAHIASEITYNASMPYGTDGYRSDCRNIPFSDVLYVDHMAYYTPSYSAKAWFKRNDGIKASASSYGNWNVNGGSIGSLFTGYSTVDASYSYQLNICDDDWMQVGFMMSGYNGCYKACGNWCGDTASPYFRVNGDTYWGTFGGVAFNENGHGTVTNKLMSVGIR